MASEGVSELAPSGGWGEVGVRARVHSLSDAVGLAGQLALAPDTAPSFFFGRPIPPATPPRPPIHIILHLARSALCALGNSLTIRQGEGGGSEVTTEGSGQGRKPLAGAYGLLFNKAAFLLSNRVATRPNLPPRPPLCRYTRLILFHSCA